MKEGIERKRANPVLAFGLIGGLLAALLLLPNATLYQILGEGYLAAAAAIASSPYGQALGSPGLALPGGVIVAVAYLASLPRAAYFLWRSYRFLQRRRESITPAAPVAA